MNETPGHNWQLTLEQSRVIFMYEVIFVIGESDVDDEEKEIITLLAEDYLKEKGFPTEFIYDNEGEPMIDWTSYGFPPEFNYIEEVQGEDNDLLDESLKYFHEVQEILLSPKTFTTKQQLLNLINK
jgi:hypothetical protein